MRVCTCTRVACLLTANNGMNGCLDGWVNLRQLEQAEDLDDDVPALLERFEQETGRQLLHSVMFY